MSSKYTRIPFRAQFRESLLADLKVYTARPQAMGVPGQMFVAFGTRFMLTEVEPIELSYVCEELYKQEGFKSPEEFVETWEKIHPYKGYTPTQIVYLHKFFRVPVHYPKRDREALINAFGKEAIEAADKIIVVPTEVSSVGKHCEDPDCWCNPPKLPVVHSEETKPKRKRSRKKKNV